MCQEKMTEPASIGRTLDVPFDRVLESARRALAEEGFGILCTIDIQATLREKLGVEHPPHVILGACNPPLAHRVLTAEPEVAVMLPCNVVVRDLGNGKTRVDAANPHLLATLFGNDTVHEVAHEVGDKLERVLEALPES